MRVLMVVGFFLPRYAGGLIQAIYLSKELARQGVDVEFAANNFDEKSVV